MKSPHSTSQQIILLLSLLLSPFLAADDYSEYSQDTAQFVADALTNYAKKEHITLWHGPVTVIVVAEKKLSEQDMTLISSIVQSFNQTLSGTKITLKFDKNDSEAKIWTDGVATLAIGEEDYLEELREEQEIGGEQYIRYWFEYNDTTKKKQTIKTIAFIDIEEAEEVGLKRLVSKGLLQMLGFPGSPVELKDSILYPKDKKITELNPLDHRMLRFTYRHVESGSGIRDLKRLLKEHWSTCHTAIPPEEQFKFEEKTEKFDPNAPRIPNYYSAPGTQTVSLWRTMKMLKNVMVDIKKEALPHRNWSDTEGRSFQGDLISWDEKNANIRNSQGLRTYTVPRPTLSEQDNDYLNQLSAKIYHGELALFWTKKPDVKPTPIEHSNHLQVIPKEDLILSDRLKIKSTHYFDKREKVMVFLRLDIYEQSPYLTKLTHKIGSLIVAPREGVTIKPPLEPEEFITYDPETGIITITRPEGIYQCKPIEKSYIITD